MTVPTRFITPFMSALLLVPALIGLGCGDDGLGKRYAVSGKVTYKGEPVKKGNINFIPTDPDGHGATGLITDGQYSLSTLNPGDGALPGTYKVTVDDRQVNDQQVKADLDALSKQRGINYSRPPEEMLLKATKAAKGALPGKYQIPSTSGLEKQVKAESNTFNFELTD